VVERRAGWIFPDTCAGTDSHTTMVNGLGVLAWGVGGIEAEAALLGQPVTMLVPPVVGVHLRGALQPGLTATDLVLTLTETLRRHGVVGKIVEFTGTGLASLTLATRATISNMSPEFGSTSAVFPIDQVTLDYLRFTGRSSQHVDAVEQYSRMQGLWHDPFRELRYDERIEFDMSEVEPSIAGPRRPQDRIALADAKRNLRASLGDNAPSDRHGPRAPRIRDGAVAIAAITSCTNTSNPRVMMAAGLVARNARQRGLTSKPWVKTSLAPGSKTVTDYLDRAGLTRPLDELGFQLVGYGCMTCIGNSGPLLGEMAEAVASRQVVAASVLSGNRNFDGRINNDVSLNYLASPPLVVAYALAGTMDHDFSSDPVGLDPEGRPVYLRDLWPDDAEIDELVATGLTPKMFTDSYAHITTGDERWESLETPRSQLFSWDEDSTYIRRPPFFDGIPAAPEPRGDITGARILELLGDSVTTDHISPAGRIPTASLAGQYLHSLGVAREDLNTYASRRGNFEVMMRGGFSNPRLKNALVEGVPGGRTVDFTADGRVGSVFDASSAYRARGIPLVIMAGAEYGTGSSRDWAAKVTALLGVRVVIARSFERIHRSNLIQMGVLPLQFLDGQDASTLGVAGSETIDVLGLHGEDALVGATVRIVATRSDGSTTLFDTVARVDTVQEQRYFDHGGILPFVFRDIVGSSRAKGAYK
jgi:aconitate hydratase